MSLPAGLITRPLTLADARAVTEVMAADELESLGSVQIEEADIVGDWGRPSFDLAASTIGVFEDEALLGYAEVSMPGRGDACVHPGQRGRGIGTWLAGWMQDLARQRGYDDIGMPVPAGSPGEKLLRGLGYRTRWESWGLLLPPGREIADQPLPQGYSLRIAAEDDLLAAYHVVEDAFLEWAGRDKSSFEDWLSGVTGRPGHQPWNLQVVTDPAGEVVGAVHVTLSEDTVTGYVDKVAVRADQRHRGLARALLVAAFRSAREHGASRSELSTDSRTGALDLYLAIGMEVDSTWVNLGIEVAR